MSGSITFERPVQRVSPSQIKYPSMVLMYTDTCPHCKGYAPIYQKVAKLLEPKLPQLHFYAINASTPSMRMEIANAGLGQVTAVPYVVLVTQDSLGKKMYNPIEAHGMLVKIGEQPPRMDSPESIPRLAASMYITASNVLDGTELNPEEVLRMFMSRKGGLMNGEKYNFLFGGGASPPLETKEVDNMSDNTMTENVTQPEVAGIEGGGRHRGRMYGMRGGGFAEVAQVVEGGAKKRSAHRRKSSHRRSSSHRRRSTRRHRRSASRSKSPKRHHRMRGGAAEAVAAPEVAEAIVGGAAPAPAAEAIVGGAAPAAEAIVGGAAPAADAGAVEGGAKKRSKRRSTSAKRRSTSAKRRSASAKRRSGSSKRGRRSPNRFAKSMAMARKALGITGFVALRKSGGGMGERLYKETKKIYEGR